MVGFGFLVSGFEFRVSNFAVVGVPAAVFLFWVSCFQFLLWRVWRNGIIPGMIDLNVDLGGLKMAVPVTTASGTFGYGVEYADLLD